MEIHCTEMHTSGEPLRIIESGFPNLDALSLLGKRRLVLEKYDNIRKCLMSEPRGHPAMYGAILCAPGQELPEADLTVLFTHNEGLSTMCGHGVIALARYAVIKGMVARSPDGDTPVKIHCPCGLVEARVSQTDYVTFTSVPAFVMAENLDITIQGTPVKVDVSYGGAFYVILECTQLGINIREESIQRLTVIGDLAKKAVMEKAKLFHPESEDLCFIYGTVLTDGMDGKESCNLVIFADKQIDRSPCGSGVTARLALQYHKKQAKINEMKTFRNSKVMDSVFRGEVVKEETVILDGRTTPAVRVEVTGKAYFTGTSVFTVETDDPLRNGFLLD